jgi:hypothetical protein
MLDGKKRRPTSSGDDGNGREMVYFMTLMEYTHFSDKEHRYLRKVFLTNSCASQHHASCTSNTIDGRDSNNKTRMDSGIIFLEIP